MQMADIISSFGVAFILVTFFLSIFKVIKTDSHLYYLANIIGGSFACYGSVLLTLFPFTILEGNCELV